MAKQQPEYHLQKQVCDYLNLQFPKVLYLSDTVASVKLTMMQAIRNKAIQKGGFKCPDVIIFEPKGIYHALFIELKVKPILKRSGELLKNEHIEGQQKTINDLNALNYFATFAVGFDEAKKIIDNYLNHS
jgi:hypothetical protein